MPSVTMQTDLGRLDNSVLKLTASVAAACYSSLVLPVLHSLGASPHRGILKHNQKSGKIGQVDAQGKV